MQIEKRKQILLKLLAGYPSMLPQDEQSVAALIASYLDKTRWASLDVLSEACDAAGTRPGTFPPSAGDLNAECNREAARRAAEKRRDTPRISPPPRPIDTLGGAARDAAITRAKALVEDFKRSAAAEALKEGGG